MSLFIDSFQHYNSATLMARKWDAITNPASVFFDPAVKSNAYQTHTLQRKAGGASPLYQKNGNGTQEWTMGYRLYFDSSWPGAWQSFCIFRQAGGELLRVRIDNAGFMYVQRGDGALLVPSTDIGLRFAQWRMVDVYCRMQDAPNGILRVRSGGQIVINYTGDTSHLGGATVINNILFDMGPPCHVADFYCRDDPVWPLEKYLPDGWCLYHKANGDGAVQQWTPFVGPGHAVEVDDSVPDDDTTYLSETTPGQEDTNHVEDLLVGGTVHVVQAVTCAKTTTSGTIKQGPRRGGTSYYGANHALGGPYAYFTDAWETDPSGGGWTAGGYNAAEKVINMVS